MLRWFGSALILSLWLAFFVLDIANDLNLIHEAGEEVADTVDSALANFGEAIKISQQSQGDALDITSPRFTLANLSLHQIIPVSAPAHSFNFPTGETLSHKERFSLHRLHQVFLI